MIPAVYKNMCPNCQKDISSFRLEKGLLCENCLKTEIDSKKICEKIDKGEFIKICKIKENVSEFENFFIKFIKNPLNSIQKTWAYRFFSDTSFAMIAPTGIGKTTFGLILSLFLQNKNKKTYLLFPTQILVNENFKKLKSLSKSPSNIVGYFSTKKKEKEKIKERIKSGDFDILITTTMFLYKNSEIIPKGIFDLIFIDDVDSVVKSGKNIDKVLKLLNFNKKELDKAFYIIKNGQVFSEKEFFEKLSNKRKGLLIVSTATSNPRSYRIKLFKELLGFEVGKPTIYLRNIVDVYEFVEKEKLEEKTLNLLKRFKTGGLVFLSSSFSKDIKEFVEFLNKNGIKAISYEDFLKYEDDFLNEKIDVIVGYSSYRNPLARGINLPATVRYAIFVGVPRFSDDIPDLTGYIQASGRTSRLYFNKLTLGLSYLLVEDKELFYQLRKKLRWYSDEIEFHNIEEIDLNEILKNIDKEREKIKKGIPLVEEKEFLKTILIIVESPNKARTIANFFGKPLKRRINNIEVYEIAVEGRLIIISASKGHLFDLIKEGFYFGVEKQANKIIPYFEPIDQDRKKIVSALRKLTLEIDETFIATDPDTEGEKIGFDIFLNLKTFNEKIKRIEFHEVTKKAFKKAIEEFRSINSNLVKAQFLRRIADRWVGFKISQYLQRNLNKNWLSAGRVQTPVLSWIVERAKLAKQKVGKVFVKINEIEFVFEFENITEAKRFFNNLKFVKVEKDSENTEKLNIKPFTTDTLLREIAKIYKFSPQKIMEIAQTLFELGLITYHRTDSIRVSDVGIKVAKEFILEHFGKDYFKPKTFSFSHGAHECIRPTRPMDKEDIIEFIKSRNLKNIKNEHIKVYDLIFKTFIASQMRDTVVKKIKYKLSAFEYSTTSEVITEIIEDGYNKIFPVKIYTPIKEGIAKDFKKYLRYYPKMPLFTFSTIIEEMKKKGIGRPSTYAITIKKLIDRNYIVEKNGYLIPTSLGIEVLNELKNKKEYSKFVEENFTKQLEEKMDFVQEGKVSYFEELENLFKELFL